MPSKSTSGRAPHAFKSAIDGLQNDATLTDRQRAAAQAAALDLYQGLNGDSFAGKTATLAIDVYNSATTPSMSVSLAFT